MSHSSSGKNLCGWINRSAHRFPFVCSVKATVISDISCPSSRVTITITRNLSPCTNTVSSRIPTMEFSTWIEQSQKAQSAYDYPGFISVTQSDRKIEINALSKISIFRVSQLTVVKSSKSSQCLSHLCNALINAL